jgi:hypothetical protein
VGHAAAADHPISLIVPLSARGPLPETVALPLSSLTNIIIEFVLVEYSQKYFQQTCESEQTVDTSPADRAGAFHGVYTEFAFWLNIAFTLTFNASKFAISLLKVRPFRLGLLSCLLFSFPSGSGSNGLIVMTPQHLCLMHILPQLFWRRLPHLS